MEVKTLEHYVVDRLYTLEEENSNLRKELELLSKQCSEYTNIVQRIANDIRVCDCDINGEHYLSFNAPWEKTDVNRFFWYLDVLHIDLPQQEVELKCEGDEDA